jgi:hypothetical protein
LAIIWGMKLPRFKLQTLLISVSLLCLFFGWLSYQFHWIRQRHEVLEQKLATVSIPWPVPHTVPPAPAPWLLRWLGENGYSRVMVSPEATEAEFDRITNLFPEAKVIEAIFPVP